MEKLEASKLKEKADIGKSEREQSQAAKLKAAYENMVRYEAQRE